MRLTDLTTEREDGENDEKVLEDEEVIEESATTELMSDNEARSLLRQLEVRKRCHCMLLSLCSSVFKSSHFLTKRQRCKGNHWS